MIISFDRKKWFKNTHIEIDTNTSTIAVPNRRTNPVVRGLMRMALSKGCSVITYGSYTDYYRYVSDIAPNQLSVVEYKELMDDAMLPFISGSCSRAVEAVEGCFNDFMFEGRYKFLDKRENGQQFRDPNRYQTFFQIKTGDIAKQKAVTEAFLVNIIAQGLYNEPLHEVVIFLDMPLKPVTETALEYLKKIRDTSNISLITLFKSELEDGQPCVLESDGENLLIKVPNKEFLISYGQIFKE